MLYCISNLNIGKRKRNIAKIQQDESVLKSANIGSTLTDSIITAEKWYYLILYYSFLTHYRATLYTRRATAVFGTAARKFDPELFKNVTEKTSERKFYIIIIFIFLFFLLILFFLAFYIFFNLLFLSLLVRFC